MFPRFFLFIALALTCGCFELKDSLTLNADGSGKWEVRLSNVKMGDDLIGNETDFRRAVAKIPGARVTAYEQFKEGERVGVRATMEFASIAAVYSSHEIANLIGWKFARQGGALWARRRSPFPGSGDLDEKDIESLRVMLNGFKLDRTLVLPGRIQSANRGAGPQSGRSVRWVTEVTKESDEKELAKLYGSYEAACFTAELGFDLPLAPPEKQSELSREIESSALDISRLQLRGPRGAELVYVPNTDGPYTGWFEDRESPRRFFQIERGRLIRMLECHGRTRKLAYDAPFRPRAGNPAILAAVKDRENFPQEVLKGGLHGTYLSWFENGQKERELQFRDSRLHGAISIWFDNGQLRETSFAEDGKHHGPAAAWHRNGQKQSKVLYHRGTVRSAKGWNPDGTANGTQIAFGTGKWIGYDEEGNQNAEQQYDKGVLMRHWAETREDEERKRTYYKRNAPKDDLKIEAEEIYERTPGKDFFGRPVPGWRLKRRTLHDKPTVNIHVEFEYLETGEKKAECLFEDHRLKSITEFTKRGIKTALKTYEDDKIVSTEEFHADGTRARLRTPAGDNGEKVLHFGEDGRFEKQEHFDDGELVESIKYRDAGIMAERKFYREGKLIMHTEFDEQGKMKLTKAWEGGRSPRYVLHYFEDEVIQSVTYDANGRVTAERSWDAKGNVQILQFDEDGKQKKKKFWTAQGGKVPALKCPIVPLENIDNPNLKIRFAFIRFPWALRKALSWNKVPKVQARLKVLVDPAGQMKLLRILWVSYDHELLEKELKEIVNDAWTYPAPGMDGQGVAVISEFPLTLEKFW